LKPLRQIQKKVHEKRMWKHEWEVREVVVVVQGLFSMIKATKGKTRGFEE
jgi:hypothetical protein